MALLFVLEHRLSYQQKLWLEKHRGTASQEHFPFIDASKCTLADQPVSSIKARSKSTQSFRFRHLSSGPGSNVLLGSTTYHRSRPHSSYVLVS